MHSFVTSKNVKWCHLIWPTLYIAFGSFYDDRLNDENQELSCVNEFDQREIWCTFCCWLTEHLLRVIIITRDKTETCTCVCIWYKLYSD